MDIEFERDGIIKTTHEKFTDDLKAVGWTVVGEEQKPDREALKKEAEELGLEFAGNISTVKLVALIEDAKADE